jgi:hypothetical protein
VIWGSSRKHLLWLSFHMRNGAHFSIYTSVFHVGDPSNNIGHVSIPRRFLRAKIARFLAELAIVSDQLEK